MSADARNAMRSRNRLREFWRWLWRRHKITGVRLVDSRRHLPSKLGSLLYVVGKGAPTWVVFECPCRCGYRINAKLTGSGRNVWSFGIVEDRASLQPSFLIP